MKAVVMYPGGSVRFMDMPKPEVKDDQVLIKVAACGICGSDLHSHHGMTGTWALPGIIGHEFSGTVVECGKDVRGISVGDNVTVQPMFSCGECECCKDGKTNICENIKLIGGELPGGCAEFAVVPANNVIPLPKGMAAEAGALAEPAACCVHAVRRLGGRHYRRVLLVGAGTIGLLTLAALKGHADMIVVCDTIQSRLDLAKSMGAAHCIRADIENVIDKALELSNDLKYDLVIEAVGSTATRELVMGLMKFGADFLMLGWGDEFTNVDFNYMVTRECTLYGTNCHTLADFEEAFRLIENKTIDYDKLVVKMPIEKAEYAFDNAQLAIKIHLIP